MAPGRASGTQWGPTTQQALAEGYAAVLFGAATIDGTALLSSHRRQLSLTTFQPGLHHGTSEDRRAYQSRPLQCRATHPCTPLNGHGHGHPEGPIS